MDKSNRETLYLKSRAQWRKWLSDNHQIKQSIWLVCNSQRSGLPTVPWGQLVEEALCFGWIDSTRTTIDEFTSKQLFSKRKHSSTWTKINNDKVQMLIDKGLMAVSGYQTIEVAKQTGSLTLLDAVEQLIVPADLEEAFERHKGSKNYFLGLSKSLRKMMLRWIVLAKRPETRQKRIDEIAMLAGENKRPKQF